MKTISLFCLLSVVFLSLSPIQVYSQKIDKKREIVIEKQIETEPPKTKPVQVIEPIVEKVKEVDFLLPTSKEVTSTTKVVSKKKPAVIKPIVQKSIKVDTKPNYTVSQEEVIELIKKYSQEYGLDEVRVLRIAKCESGYNPKALSSSSRYKGLFQWDSSFYGWAKKLGIENPDPFNPEHNTRAATLAMSFGLWSKWTCK